MHHAGCRTQICQHHDHQSSDVDTVQRRPRSQTQQHLYTRTVLRPHLSAAWWRIHDTGVNFKDKKFNDDQNEMTQSLVGV